MAWGEAAASVTLTVALATHCGHACRAGRPPQHRPVSTIGVAPCWVWGTKPTAGITVTIDTNMVV